MTWQITQPPVKNGMEDHIATPKEWHGRSHSHL